MKKFFNDNMFMFVLLALAAVVVALVFAIGNKKKIKVLEGMNHLTADERAKLEKLAFDDNGQPVAQSAASDE